MILKTKTCKCCNETKSIEYFHIRKDSIDGRRNNCIECHKQHKKIDKTVIFDKVKQAFSDRGCKLISNEMMHHSSRLDYICKCGAQNTVSFQDFQRYKNGGCKSCLIKYKRNLYIRDIEEVNKILNCEGYILMSTYNGQNNPITLKCPNGHVKQFFLTNFVRGHRCQKCYFSFNKGKNHHNWIHEKTDEERLIGRATPENWEFRKKVYERDGWTCQICHKKGGNLCVHHLDGFNWCIEKRYDLNNGITLCDGQNGCHQNFHKEYGYGYNTKLQFNEFVEKCRSCK